VEGGAAFVPGFQGEQPRLMIAEEPQAAGKGGRVGRAGSTPRWLAAAGGLTLAVLAGSAALDLGAGAVPLLRDDWALLLLAAAGLAIAGTRARVLLWVGAGLTALTLLVVAYTPLVTPLVGALVRNDPLEPADAVVVLSSNVRPDGTLDKQSQARVLHAYGLLHDKLAPRLVLTRLEPPRPSSLPAVQDQMRHLGLSYPVEETAAIANTHDEALRLQELIAAHGWRRVILVTDPTHSRRAAATFEKTGVPVLSSPGPDLDFSLTALERPGERIRAFSKWVYEVVGYQVYRRRGWL
jgi:hypothetical protein